MNMIRIFSVMLFVAVSFTAFPAGKYKFPAQLSKQMAYERDVFLLGRPADVQDKESRAIKRAQRGDFSELNKVRESSKRSYTPSEEVEILNLSLGLENFITAEGGMKARLYRPIRRTDVRPLPLLVYFHGGGWVKGDMDSCADFCDALASTGDVMVLAVNYRLSPENPFPLPLEDAMAALYYAFRKAAEWGGDMRLVSVGGDGAGGNLAIMAALGIGNASNSSCGMRLRSIVAVYPVINVFEDESLSWKNYGQCYGLDSDLMVMYNIAYLAGCGKSDDSKISELETFASPYYTDDSFLAKMPEFLLIAAGQDVLRDQGEFFVDRLKRLGVKAGRVEFEQACHLFVSEPGQPTAFREAVKCIQDFLKGTPDGNLQK